MVDKAAVLDWIYESYVEDVAHPALPAPFVGGCGSMTPKAILVGEAPGRTEADTCLPFAGRAGQRLDDHLDAVGLSRHDLWVTNVVKLRPRTPDAEGRDRPPTVDEVAVSMPYLWRELELIGGGTCRVICALGKTAVSALWGRDVAMGASHGKWLAVIDPAGVKWAVFATYHPAAALRSPAADAALRADLAAFREQVERLGDFIAAHL